jgi:hypothetical protein
VQLSLTALLCQQMHVTLLPTSLLSGRHMRCKHLIAFDADAILQEKHFTIHLRR